MNRQLALAVLAGALTIVGGAMAVTASESNIADSFPKAGSYSANTGMQNWSGPWVEETESDGATAGSMRVVQGGLCGGSCLRISHSLLVGTQSIHRDADLAGAGQAILRFTLSRQGLGAANLNVEATGDGTVFKQFPASSDTPTVRSLDISDVVNENTEIRFDTLGLGVGMAVFIDDVRIDLVYPDSTTTTITTTTTLIPLPSTTLPSLPTTTVALLPTTTSTPSSSSTTTRPGSTTTLGSTPTSTEDSGATATTLPPPPSDFDQTPPTGLELDVARLSGVTLNMVPEAPPDLGFTFGVNPVTGLTVNFSSVVEVIKAEFLSALGLGTMVAFFAVGGWKREDDEGSEESRS